MEMECESSSEADGKLLVEEFERTVDKRGWHCTQSKTDDTFDKDTPVHFDHSLYDAPLQRGHVDREECSDNEECSQEGYIEDLSTLPGWEDDLYEKGKTLKEHTVYTSSTLINVLKREVIIGDSYLFRGLAGVKADTSCAGTLGTDMDKVQDDCNY